MTLRYYNKPHSLEGLCEYYMWYKCTTSSCYYRKQHTQPREGNRNSKQQPSGQSSARTPPDTHEQAEGGNEATQVKETERFHKQTSERTDGGGRVAQTQQRKRSAPPAKACPCAVAPLSPPQRKPTALPKTDRARGRTLVTLPAKGSKP